MLSNARTAAKFLTYGLVIGLLFAPRSGAETRKELLGWVSASVKDTVNSVTGSVSSGTENRA
jgi:gas vesicle protein